MAHTQVDVPAGGPLPGGGAPPARRARATRHRAAPSHRGPAQSARRGHIDGLDGVRAIAIVAVLAYHLHPVAMPGGFLGVDVFFVVSGFLITTLLLREIGTKGRIDLPRFWLRRARRLLPALVSVVVLTIPFAWLASTDLLVSIGRQALGALTFSNNWLEIAAGTSYFTRTAPQLFVNFWSLAVEEQFYLLWPIVLAVLVAAVASPRRRALVALGAAALSAGLMAALYTPGEDATRVYYGTDTHLFGLMIGAALAFTWAAPGGGLLAARAWRRWRGLLALVALTGLVVLMLTVRQSAAFTFRGGILLASLLTAVVIAGLLGPSGPVRSLMRLAPLEWIGQRSYGIYLWHWPVILVVGEMIPTAYGTPGYWGVRALALALTLGVAAVSFRYLEQPVRTLGFRAAWHAVRGALTARVPGPRVVLARLGAAVAGLAVAASLAAIAVAPESSRTQLQIEAAQAELDAADRAPARAPVVEGADGAGPSADETAERTAGPGDPAADPGAAPPDYSMPSGEEITGFGDSIVVTSLDGLEARFPGIMLDAESIRQWPDGEAAVAARLAEGTVRRAVFLDFGTNAGVRDEALVRRVLDSLGHRMIVVVNLYGGSYWVPEANATLARIVADYPNAIVADWHGAISARPELLQVDDIHPGIEGAHLYADVVANAFAALSERLAGVPVDPGAAQAGT